MPRDRQMTTKSRCVNHIVPTIDPDRQISKNMTIVDETVDIVGALRNEA